MPLPIKPETLPRKAVELLEFIEWLDRTKSWALLDMYDRTVSDIAICDAATEYLGLRLCPECQEMRPQKQFDSNDGKLNRTKCIRCSAPPRKQR